MKTNLVLPVDSEQVDLGVGALIEANRDLFEQTGGRDLIAAHMGRLLNGSRSVTRQMVEKWFNRKDRTIPSGVLLVALLTACAFIKERQAEHRAQARQAVIARKQQQRKTA